VIGMSNQTAVVAHVVLSLDPGGLERMVINLTGAQPIQSAIRTIVCCLDGEGALSPDMERCGGQMFTFHRKPGFDLDVVRRLSELLRRERVTVVHTHTLDAMLYGGLAGHLARVPRLVHTQHNRFLETASTGDRLQFRMAARLFHDIVAVSGDTRQVAVRAGASRGKIVTIPNGVEVGPAVRRDRGDRGPVVVGALARLSREKGLDHLVRAFAHVVRRAPGTRLRIAGDGPQRGELESLSRSLGLEHAVEFLGHRGDVADVLAGFDVFTLPSRSEGVPLALLEAMASGLPAVASRIGGVPEVLDEASGMLVAPGDEEALANAIVALADDPVARCRRGAAARARVESEFTLDVMAERYRALYEADPPSRLVARAARRAFEALPAAFYVAAGNRASSAVAMTFDDGPDETYTPAILDLLRARDAKATFFVIGERALLHPEVMQRIVDEGHELGNHSFTHPDFRSLTLGAASREIDRANAPIAAVQQRPCRWFRAPKGRLSLGTMWSAWRRAMTVVGWSVDLKDFRAPTPQHITGRLAVRPVEAGDIVLYHGHSPAALSALPAVLDAARDRGLRLVSLSELAG
jgi:glycosyltransferase involved in cell wall biosynthesis/peptidoglycan/xylan/chitin deacetylase (PgdA/CDA1 family)